MTTIEMLVDTLIEAAKQHKAAEIDLFNDSRQVFASYEVSCKADLDESRRELLKYASGLKYALGSE